MTEAEQIAKDAILDWTVRAYGSTPSGKVDAFINALQSVKCPNTPEQTTSAWLAASIMLEGIRRMGHYRYGHISGAHVVNAQREWFKNVDNYSLIQKTVAREMFSELGNTSLGNSTAEYVSWYIDNLVLVNEIHRSSIKARLHLALTTAPDGVSKVDTSEALRVLKWVIDMWLNIPGYRVEYHGLFKEVYETYHDLVVADRKANKSATPQNSNACDS